MELAIWGTMASIDSITPAGFWLRLQKQRERRCLYSRGPSQRWGGKYYFDDDQQWPDTLMVTYDFAGGYVLTYEMRIWTPYNMHDESEGAVVLGMKAMWSWVIAAGGTSIRRGRS